VEFVWNWLFEDGQLPKSRCSQLTFKNGQNCVSTFVIRSIQHTHGKMCVSHFSDIPGDS